MFQFMKPIPAIRRLISSARIAGRLLLGTIALLLGLSGACAQDEPPQFDSIRPVGATTVRIGLTGPTNRFLRVDGSTNLAAWTPLRMLSPGGPARRELDEVLSPGGRGFFRAREVAAGTALFAARPNRGSPGEVIELAGQFFAEGRPDLHQVDLGGARAEVLSAGPFLLRVRVPAAARSGLIRVSGPDGEATAVEPFLVIREVPAEVRPPGAVAADGYLLANHLTEPLPYVTGAKLRVRLGLPLISVAYPRDDASDAVLMTVSDGSETNLVFDARSTAEALLLLHPALNTTDPGISSAFRVAAQGLPSVTGLAQRIATRYAAGQTSFTDEELQRLLAESVRGILTNSTARAALTALAARAPARSRIQKQALTGVAVAHKGDLEFTDIETIDDKGKPLKARTFRFVPGLGPRPPYLNGADWVVAIEEVDLGRAFPNGRDDFNQLWRHPEELRFPPVIPGSRVDQSIGGDFPSERFNPVKFLTGELFDLIKGVFHEEEEGTTFPNRDALYMVRAVGGGFHEPKETEFAATYLFADRNRALIINLVALVTDTLGVLLDKEDISVTSDAEKKDRAEFMFKLSLEAEKQVSTIRSPEDVLGALPELLKWVATELVDKAKEEGLKHGAAAALGRGAKKLGETLAGFEKYLKIADIGGGLLQIAQRLDTLGNSSAIETAYIEIGDPFSLRIREITPTVAGPASVITITFVAPTNVPTAFLIGRDVVQFEGPELFEGRVLSARPGFVEGDIDLRVEIPKNLAANVGGDYVVSVIARGRRGEGKIRLTTRPVISAVSPQEGYAATADFLGRPFEGSFIRIRGANFFSTNRFLIAGGGKREAKVISGIAGDVTIAIPEGAVTSVIAVERPTPEGGIEVAESASAVRVLGVPFLESVAPVRGPVNTLIRFHLREGGPAPGLISLLFPNGSTATPTGADGFYQVRVPEGNRTGTVRVRTPGGQSEFEFTMEGGRPAGGRIQAGGISVIKDLQRALDFAQGTATPEDDADYRVTDAGKRIELDPPLEEGDFVTDTLGTGDVRFPVGALFADRVYLSGTFTGPAFFDGDYDTIEGGIDVGDRESGVIDGDLTLSGDGCVVRDLEIRGTLVLAGDHNTLDVRVKNAPGHGLVLRGHDNRITITVENCGGDGIRIEGGEGNQITIVTNQGNSGNGIVLTGGAAHNALNPVFAGQTLARDNRGHGVVLTEGAAHNRLEGLVAGNTGDGVRLDGPGVIGNLLGDTRELRGLVSAGNGGNGVTFTNGPASNRAGHLRVLQRSGLSGSVEFVPLTAVSNRLHGIAVHGPAVNDLQVKCAANGGCGLLLRDHAVPENASPYYVETGAAPGEGNGEAGLRLDGDTRNVTLLGNLEFDHVGVILDGPNVRQNYLGSGSVVRKFGGPGGGAALADSLYIRNATTDGLVVRFASGNTLLPARLEGCGGAGLLISGGSSNVVGLSLVRSNLGPAIHLTAGAHHNVFSELLDLPPRRVDVSFNGYGIRLSQAAHENTFSRLAISRSALNAALLEDEGTAGNQLFDLRIDRSGSDGIVLRAGASGNRFGPAAGLADRVSFINHTNVLVRVTGPRTADNVFRNVETELGLGVGAATGAVVEAAASGTVFDHCYFSSLSRGVVIRDFARNTTLRATTIYSAATHAVLIENAVDTLIGGPAAADANVLTRLINAPGTGIEVTGAGSARNRILNNQISAFTTAGVVLRDGAHDTTLGPGNSISRNQTGILVSGATDNLILGNTLSGSLGANIRMTEGATTNRVVKNTLSTAPLGIQVDGKSSLGNRFDKNSITGHAGKGISLENGGNRQLPEPHSLQYDGRVLSGVAPLASGGLVQIFRDGADEGATPLAQGRIDGSVFNVAMAVDPAAIGVLFQLRATATDAAGNTSEFSTSPVRKPLGARIAFTSDRDGDQEIYLLDDQPSGRRITTHGAADHSPSLSGSSIAFVSDRTGNREIFVASDRGAILRQVTANAAPDYDPTWTRDAALVFVSERDGNPELYSVRFDGSQLTRLTSDPATDRWPVVSPDGTRIAFASDRGGKFGIYTMRIDGTGLEAVGQTGLDDTQPAWSGDGRQLTFVSQRDGNPEIYVVRADGTDLRRVAPSPARDLHPTWLPGDKQLLFSSDRWGVFALTVADVSGGEPRRLTLNPGNDTEPVATAR